ncbi:M4 family metallopeptidase [Streptomyces formicae]|uniref:Neutral metalloproteinase n=1 Tax=Streptomyces formicae TaxID=1616117 RepID=A0A291Q1H1_9ACTN|nr:M4 family metallopeptidase [Streptomyces formicae]ATL25591.1 putative metalloproteinase [Streptomyces formicae]
MLTSHIRSLAIVLAVTTPFAVAVGGGGPALAASEATAPAASAGFQPVINAARTAADAHAAATGVGKGDTLQATDVLIDPDGKQHVRFMRSHQGLPVLGGDLVIHLSKRFAYTGVTRAVHQPVQVATTRAKLTTTQAQAKAAATAKGTAGAAQLVVDARARHLALAYQIHVTDSSTTESGTRTVVLDAASGSILSNTPTADSFLSPRVREKLRKSGQKLTPSLAAATPRSSKVPGFPAQAKGTGKSLFVGSVPLITTQTAKSSFTLEDPSRGQTDSRDAGNRKLTRYRRGRAFTSTTNHWGNGEANDRSTAAVDVQYGITRTLDFYKKTFGRNGIKNDGAGVHALVHFGSRVGNAFWAPDCGCMEYGDGDGKTLRQPVVALDITGHELTHGVVAATANLQGTYADAHGNLHGESASLNESLADIFGSNVEFATNNPNNPPNYLIGEKLGLRQGFLRRLDHPSLDKLEGVVENWSPGLNRAEAHKGSGVSSHAYYLLAEGSGRKTINGVAYNSPTCDGSSVTGIGRDKATQIFYRALTRYMVSTTDFHDARTATLRAAADLYGGASSTEYKTVDKAWAAVNVTAANAPSRS